MTKPRYETFRKVTVVVPVYNGAANLGELVERVTAALAPGDHEIVLVNDGSQDDSWAVVEQLAARHRPVVGIDLVRNYGQHNALLAGIRQATGDIVVTLDDDLQHPPEHIPRLLEELLLSRKDVIYATPQREQHGLWRDAASKLTKLALQRAMGVEIARNVSAFRAFRTDLRDAFASYQGPWVAIDVLLAWGTSRFGAVEVAHLPRARGRSNYTLRRLASHALNLITGFSTWPLRVASIIGFAFTLFGIAILVYVLARFFGSGHSVPGFPFLASVIAIFGGVQLFALGIIGEYLARMHVRMMDRPPYTIRRTTRENE